MATPESTRSLRSQRCDFVDLVQSGNYSVVTLPAQPGDYSVTVFPAQNGFFTPPEFTRGMTSLSLGPHYEAHSGAILQHRPPCLLAGLVSTARTRPSALASLVSAAHQSIRQPLNP